MIEGCVSQAQFAPVPNFPAAVLTCYWPGVYIRQEMRKVRDYEARK